MGNEQGTGPVDDEVSLVVESYALSRLRAFMVLGASHVVW